MSDDPVLNAVQKFMDAVETRIKKQDDEIRGLREQLETRSAPQVIEGPPGRDGKDGTEGKDGIDGKSGENGKDGIDGKDGTSGERGTDGLAGRDGIDGKDGEKGERGADGIVTREELGLLIEKFYADLQVRTFADIYQGVFKLGTDYTRGQFTTWGGSLWLALVDTRNKPGDGNSDWRLAIKK